jgi:tetratricopeptide (TPR) repeat protein
VNPDELAELEEQRAFLLRSLEDLERELAAGDVDELDAATLRDDYTHRLAEVQRSIEGGEASFARPAGPRRWGRTVVAVVVVGGMAVGAGFAVAGASGSRKPGESATGTIRETNSGRLSQAAQLASQGNFVEALKLYDQVIEADAENVEALSEKGLLLVSLANASQNAELAARGREAINAALSIDPKDPRALFYLGLAKKLTGDDKGADEAFDQALAADPPAALKKQIQDFRTSTGGSATTLPTPAG